jgi:hypothetical protein
VGGESVSSNTTGDWTETMTVTVQARERASQNSAPTNTGGAEQ